MGTVSDFLQDNWFELGSLIAQFGILAVIAWYVRMRLRIAATPSQPEVEPAATTSEPLEELVPQEPATARYGGVGRMLSPAPAAPSVDTVPAFPERLQRPSPWRGMIRWLRTPMTFGTRVRTAL